jgi:hypothetical protein
MGCYDYRMRDWEDMGTGIKPSKKKGMESQVINEGAVASATGLCLGASQAH